MFDVVFSPDGSFAYRPRQILIPTSSIPLAVETLQAAGWHASLPLDGEQFIEGWTRLEPVDRVLDVVEVLRQRGIPAQPNHVVFATCGCGCGCGPHPADPRANPYYANPYYANPYYANPYYANPQAANPNPGLSGAADGQHPMRSSARPAQAPDDFDLRTRGRNPVRVTVLDTGFTDPNFAPQYESGGNQYRFEVNTNPDNFDVPDTLEQNQPIDQTPAPGDDRFLDPAAGHGTFVAGVIRQLSDACDITVKRVLTTFGVGDEAKIAKELEGLLAGSAPRPHFVNLSFGGYSPYRMRPLAKAIEKLIEAKIVVVASAGNDATCQPMYPAAIPGVIGVAALDRHDTPASFTNFGPWVRACTLGVDVVSAFFDWDGVEAGNPDPDKFSGWARWSGTSFAAPRVVAALANEVMEQIGRGKDPDPYEAVKALIDDPDRVRLPMMGTLVAHSDQTHPWKWVKIATKKPTVP